MAISDWLTIIGLTLTTVAFLVGLFQYRQAQRWQALQFISNEMREFFANKDVRNVLLMLDVNQRPIDFTVQAEGEERLKTVIVSDEMIISALRTSQMREGKPITTEDGLIRDVFYTFFNYLTRFANYSEASQVIKYNDLHPFLAYWLEILTNKSNKRKSSEFADAIIKYLEFYEYNSILRMFEKYKNTKKRQW
jgi:hypothetical protein